MAVLFDLIDSSIIFIMKNFDDILLVSLGLLIFIIFKYQTDIINDRKDKQSTNTKVVKREIIVEGQTNKDEIKEEIKAITDTNSATINPCTKLTEEKEPYCNGLSDDACKLESCCVLAMKKGDKKVGCKAGDDEGPTIKDMDFDYYYYRSKSYNKDGTERS